MNQLLRKEKVRKRPLLGISSSSYNIPWKNDGGMNSVLYQRARYLCIKEGKTYDKFTPEEISSVVDRPLSWSRKVSDPIPETKKLISQKTCKSQKIYDGPRKKDFRDLVMSYMSADHNDTTLLLETDQFLYVKDMPLQNYIVPERNFDTYISMMKNAPVPMDIRYGDILNMDLSILNFNQAFLDFCDTFDTCELALRRGVIPLSRCDVLAFTFCLRMRKCNVDNFEDSKYAYTDLGRGMSVIIEISNLFGGHAIKEWIIYRDPHVPMLGIIMTKSNSVMYKHDIKAEHLMR